MAYTLVCGLITCCTAGVSFFALISIVMDVLFIGAMMAVAIINRSATRPCGSFDPPRVVYHGSGQSGCELFKAAFAVAILAIVCLSSW